MKKGERIVSTSDLDARLKILSAQIKAVLAGIFYDDGLGEIQNPLVQFGEVTVKVGIESTVTFPISYPVTPKITLGENSTGDVNAVFNTPTTTGFKLRVYNRSSGSDVVVNWTAIGKRI